MKQINNPGTMFSEKSSKLMRTVQVICIIFFLTQSVLCENNEKELSSVPKYLINLFSKLEKEGRQEFDGSYRSIFPSEGDSETLLRFDYRPSIYHPKPTSTKGVEQETKPVIINLAELHLRTRRRNKHKQNKDVNDEFAVDFLTIVGVEGGREIHLPLHSNRYPGWKRFDVTEFFQNLPGPDYTLTLRFESLDGKILPTRSILKLFRSPFLLLQTKESTPPDFTADFTNQPPQAPAVSIQVTEQPQQQPQQKPQQHQQLPRKKRFVEIMSNIEDFDHPNNMYNIEDTSTNSDEDIQLNEITKDDKNNKDRKLTEKKKKKRKKNARKMRNEVLTFYDDDSVDVDDVLDLDYEEDDLSQHEANQFRLKTDEDMIPYPKNYDFQPTKHRNVRKRTKKSKKQKKENSSNKDGLPKIWKSLEYQMSADDISEESEDFGCKLHEYKVDLRKVGFGRRIISPKTYLANYCAGNCTFPMTKSSHPTNHATVLSILSALQGPGVPGSPGSPGAPPPACCVPRKHDSLSLLYYDLDGSVVLKNYPQMSVKSCGCR